MDQAQRDFINAVLRRDSGAAINDREFANARQQNSVQPGDSQEVIAQKRANRERRTRTMLAKVPNYESLAVGHERGCKPALGRASPPRSKQSSAGQAHAGSGGTDMANEFMNELASDRDDELPPRPA